MCLERAIYIDETTAKFAYTIDELVELGCGSRSFLYEKIWGSKAEGRQEGQSARCVLGSGS